MLTLSEGIHTHIYILQNKQIHRIDKLAGNNMPDKLYLRLAKLTLVKVQSQTCNLNNLNMLWPNFLISMGEILLQFWM